MTDIERCKKANQAVQEKEETLIDMEGATLHIEVRTFKGQSGCTIFMDLLKETGSYEAELYRLSAKRVNGFKRQLYDPDTPQNMFHLHDTQAKALIQMLWDHGYRPNGIE